MGTVTFAINITADGYCGHETGVVSDELHGYFADLLRDTDVEVFGRNTYELMYPYWHDVAASGEGPAEIVDFARAFEAIPKIVFSTTLREAAWTNTTLRREGLRETILELKRQPGKRIAVGGLNIASQVAGWNLIDEYRFVVHPVIAGEGPRLFAAGGNHALELVGTRTFGSGHVALHYKNRRTDA